MQRAGIGPLPEDHLARPRQDGKEERHLGVVAFNEERFDKVPSHHEHAVLEV